MRYSPNRPNSTRPTRAIVTMKRQAEEARKKGRQEERTSGRKTGGIRRRSCLLPWFLSSLVPPFLASSLPGFLILPFRSPHFGLSEIFRASIVPTDADPIPVLRGASEARSRSGPRIGVRRSQGR